MIFASPTCIWTRPVRMELPEFSDADIMRTHTRALSFTGKQEPFLFFVTN